MRGAFPDALQAGSALHVVDMDVICVQGYSLHRTGPDAVMTVYAFLLIPEHLHFRELALRVGAPPAPQGTALEEYHRADARPVVDAEFLDVE